MKKVITIMSVLALAASVSLADLTNDYANAIALDKAGKYDDAILAYNAIVNNYPDADDDFMCRLYSHVGNIFQYQNVPYSERVEMYSSAISNYPNATDDNLITLTSSLAFCLQRVGKYQEALEVCTTSLDSYPTTLLKRRLACVDISYQIYVHKFNDYASAEKLLNTVFTYQGMSFQQLATYKKLLADVQFKQNKKLEAQKLLVEAATDYGFINLNWQSDIYNAIDFKILGIDLSIAYLQDVLLMTPAIQDNTEFLGRVKSQLEVLK